MPELSDYDPESDDGGGSKIRSFLQNHDALKQQLKAVTKKPVRPPPKSGKDTLERAHLWDPCGRKGSGEEPRFDPKGRLRTIAAMVLMTVMYSARIARYDLQEPIEFLTKRIACWGPLCDQVMHTLLCYVHKSMNCCMTG